jgi:3'(2'), 5'-bisphosphate nucleotidase
MLENELNVARTAALKAGRSILDLYAGDFLVAEKKGVDLQSEPVTEADIAASRIIVDELINAFPEDAILSEEEVDDAARRMAKDRVWIIDPLDGTAGFVKNDGDFAVQIGLAVKGVPHLGVVYMPYYDVFFYAVKGKGCFVVRKGGDPVRTTVSDRSVPTDLRLAMSKNHPSPRMERILETFGFVDHVRRGSVGLKVGLIAEQACDIYIHPSPRTKLWDTCAPQIILEEAGGRFTDLFGDEIRYDRVELQNQNGILATNGSAHTIAVEIMDLLLDEFGRTRYIYDAAPPASSAIGN